MKVCNHTTRTQQARLIDYLAMGRKLTALKALQVAGTMKASSRLGELREQGHDIRSAWVGKNGKRFKVYWLAGARKH